MKKLLKVSVVIAFMAVLFAGCSSSASDSSSSPSSDPSSTPSTGGYETLTDEGILFDKALATDDITSAVTLTDGNWIASYKSVIETALLEITEFTISDNGANVQYTSKTGFQYNTETKKIYNKTEATDSELITLNGETNFLGKYSREYMTLKSIFEHLSIQKYNKDHTKYYAEGTQTSTEGESLATTIYIMKKE